MRESEIVISISEYTGPFKLFRIIDKLTGCLPVCIRQVVHHLGKSKFHLFPLHIHQTGTNFSILIFYILQINRNNLLIDIHSHHTSRTTGFVQFLYSDSQSRTITQIVSTGIRTTQGISDLYGTADDIQTDGLDRKSVV